LARSISHILHSKPLLFSDERASSTRLSDTFLVALPTPGDLFLSAKDLLFAVRSAAIVSRTLAIVGRCLQPTQFLAEDQPGISRQVIGDPRRLGAVRRLE
jgi:hypothetical protein